MVVGVVVGTRDVFVGTKGVARSTWGVGLAGMEVGVARPSPAMGVGLPGTVVGRVATGKPQLIKRNTRRDNEMKIGKGFGWAIERLVAME